MQGALEARRVVSAGLEAEVTGRIVRRKGRLRLASVHARYLLPISPADEPAARRALDVHDRACPASQSVQPAIAVTWEAEFGRMRDEG